MPPPHASMHTWKASDLQDPAPLVLDLAAVPIWAFQTLIVDFLRHAQYDKAREGNEVC